MAQLLIVHHCPSPALQVLTDRVAEGARIDGICGVDIAVVPALEAKLDDVLRADGYILITPVNFGYLSGALKHFFDTTYDDAREPTAGRPFSYVIHGRTDTSGAERAMVAITTGLGWKLSYQPLTLLGDLTPRDEESAIELGATLAAHLM